MTWRNKWHVPHGTTATTHIIKPQIGRLPNGIDLTNSCLELVAAPDLPVAKSRIVDFAGRRVLAIERFDRIWTRDGRLLRLPQEDCCQALSVPPGRKYESDGGPGIRNVSDFLKGSDTPATDQATFFKTQIVFWLLAATDGHAKNFSIRLSPGGRFVLTPLYDIISTQPSLDAKQITQNQMKLAMAIGNNRHYVVHTVLGRHFVQAAKTCGLTEKTARGIIKELADIAGAKIDATIAKLPKDFPQAVAESIAAGAKRRQAGMAAALRHRQTTPQYPRTHAAARSAGFFVSTASVRWSAITLTTARRTFRSFCSPCRAVFESAANARRPPVACAPAVSRLRRLWHLR
ncbi:serine/threonine protein kinase HipA of HipAB toxin-antitoxin module [Bradyrhizobium sp. BR13661]|nr:serine/threonine protein kinase HipA of HipAB toxin-antitoxin module [Bradyrhizobium sp. BR13661]